MTVKITFPNPPHVAPELPVYATVNPAWDVERVTDLGMRLDVRGPVIDAGAWFVIRDGASTLEVCKASHSVRLGRDASAGAAVGTSNAVLDRARAVSVAERFHNLLGDTAAHAEIQSVTELTVTTASRGRQAFERQLAGLQVSHRFRLDGLPLVGAGAKAQVTVGRDGELVQGCRFWRDVTRRGTRPAVPPQQAFERFAATQPCGELPSSAQVVVTRVHLALLCLPPTEVQGVLLPVYALRGAVRSERLPSDEFVAYVTAVATNDGDAARKPWSVARPSSLVA